MEINFYQKETLPKRICNWKRKSAYLKKVHNLKKKYQTLHSSKWIASRNLTKIAYLIFSDTIQKCISSRITPRVHSLRYCCISKYAWAKEFFHYCSEKRRSQIFFCFFWKCAVVKSTPLKSAGTRCIKFLKMCGVHSNRVSTSSVYLMAVYLKALLELGLLPNCMLLPW
jgi:hypothetical protein